MPAGRVRLALAALMAAVAIAPPAAGEGTTIGVVPQRGFDDDEAELMGEAGISSVRDWFSWAQVEPRRGERNWGLLDDTVAANARAGMTTLPFLFGTPAWAAAEDGRDCVEGDCVSYPPISDETRAEFADFAAAAARRYGPGGAFWIAHRALPYRPVEVWQIWNEPNLSSFYRPAVDPVGYAALVEPVAAAIRRQDPDATVLLAGLTGTKTNAKRMSTTAFLTQLYSVSGIAASFDGIAVHPYNRAAGGTIDQIEAARGVATANGDRAGIWVTEVGWASAGKRRWGLVKSPDGQASSLRKAYTRLIEDAQRLGIRAVYWYAWRDTEPGHAVCGWCPWSGLLDRIGRPKQAYFELKALTDDEQSRPTIDGLGP
jgi:hypothetical protein